MSKYKIIHRISKGGFGVVYRVQATTHYATSEHTIEEGDVFAMKKFKKSKSYPSWDFIKEVDIVHRFKHENIVNAIDVFKNSEGIPCIILPLAMTDWRQYVESNRWQLEQFHQILSGIQHLHSNSVVHGDIKPTNILVFNQDSQHIAKICDFGTSTIINEHVSSALQTLPYRPPELLEDHERKHSFEADMWSIGVTLYETIMCEICLFYGGDEVTILKEIEKFFDGDEWKNFPTLGPVHALISKMLNKDPKSRITATEALEDLVFTSFTCIPGRVIIPVEERCRHKLHDLRKTVVKWMFDVCTDLKITTRSAFASIDLYDRYINTTHGCSVEMGNLQLVACAAMSITFKLLDDMYPCVKDFVFVTENTYNKHQIYIMEYKLAKHVDWILYRPSILTLLNHIPLEQLKKYYIEYSTSDEISRAYEQDLEIDSK
jgi:serine/threonine protein kinase